MLKADYFLNEFIIECLISMLEGVPLNYYNAFNLAASAEFVFYDDIIPNKSAAFSRRFHTLSNEQKAPEFSIGITVLFSVWVIRLSDLLLLKNL